MIYVCDVTVFDKQTNMAESEGHHVDFAEPVAKYTLLCSVHFEQSCFENDLAWSMGLKKRRDLVKGSIPTRHTVLPEGPEVLTSNRKGTFTLSQVLFYS